MKKSLQNLTNKNWRIEVIVMKEFTSVTEKNEIKKEEKNKIKENIIVKSILMIFLNQRF